MLRQLHMPMTLRKEYCVSQLEELKKRCEKTLKFPSTDASIPAPAQ